EADRQTDRQTGLKEKKQTEEAENGEDAAANGKTDLSSVTVIFWVCSGDEDDDDEDDLDAPTRKRAAEDDDDDDDDDEEVRRSCHTYVK
uniref:Uncharacterized protein n=1 Tax=Scophthalmus maximus TaxID=52904 RepID=A0A8D3EAL6_SCOMX